MGATGIAKAGTAVAGGGILRDLKPIRLQRQERLLYEVALAVDWAPVNEGTWALGLVIPQRAVPNSDKFLTFQFMVPLHLSK